MVGDRPEGALDCFPQQGTDDAAQEAPSGPRPAEPKVRDGVVPATPLALRRRAAVPPPRLRRRPRLSSASAEDPLDRGQSPDAELLQRSFRDLGGVSCGLFGELEKEEGRS